MGPDGELTETIEAAQWEINTSGANGNGMEMGGEKLNGNRSSPAAVRVSESPSLSAQVLPSPSVSVQHPGPAPSLDRNCVQSQAPAIDRSPHEGPTWDQLHEKCTQRGYC